MILLVHSDKSKITDFIMWADVEFAIQLQVMITRDFASQSADIIDLSELDSIRGMGGNEPLFVIAHGSPYNPSVPEPKTSLDGEKYAFSWLGDQIGQRLPGTVASVELWTCYGADGPKPYRAIDRFALGVGAHRHGVSIKGYVGATVTNTMATVAAQQASSLASTSAVLVVDESRMGTAGAVDKSLREALGPQESFNSFLKSAPRATARQKAIRAAERAEGFYATFAKTLQKQGVFYGVGSDRSNPVVVPS
jgi:hypothetical protein